MPTDLGKVSAIQDLGALVGRVLMSAIFIWGGYQKLMDAAGTKAEIAGLGVPFPDIVWMVAVVVELVGGLALLLGVQTRLVALVLAVWCIATAWVAHSNFADPDMQIHFMKNVAMAGGFIVIAVFGGGAYTVERALAIPIRGARVRPSQNP
jgi:putative oxidoreductase